MRILVVDDDCLAGQMTGAILEGAGHDVVIVEDGMAAALALNGDATIEMIVSDMNMPMVSGIDLFRELRDQGVALPFILLTGDDPETLRAQEPALDACLMKDDGLEDRLPALVAEVAARHGGA